jgi:hypothetical protein
MDAVVRSVGRRNGHRSFMDRVLGRSPPSRDVVAEELRDRGEDVWKGFRF